MEFAFSAMSHLPSVLFALWMSLDVVLPYKQSLPLRVHGNGRFLVDAHDRPVFLLSDTAWRLCTRPTRQEITDYLRKRRSQRFNAVAFVLMHTALDSNAYGDVPFRVVRGKHDPASPVVTRGRRPDDPAGYDYWDHVDFIIDQTKRFGMYAVVLPAWGDAVTGSYNGTDTSRIVFNEANARVYGQWLGKRYWNQTHVIWMTGGDVAGAYSGRDYRPVFRAMAVGLLEGSRSMSPLLSFHPQKPNPRSSAWFQNDSWLSFNSIQAWPEDQVPAVASDWDLLPAKPTWIFEGRYEAYYKNNYQPEQWGEWQVRFQAYQTVFSGAFGHTYGHERVFGFGDDGWDWKRELDAPGACSITHLAKLMNGIGEKNLLARMPAQDLVDGPEGRAERFVSDRITAMRTEDGNLALFYSANGRAVRVRMDRLAAKPMNAWWFNPRNGNWHADGVETTEQKSFTDGIPSGPGECPREFDPPGVPGDGNDWVLVLCGSKGM